MAIASDQSLDAADMAPRRRAWLPFGDPSRARRLVKIAGWLGGVALVVGVLELLGVDVARLVLGPVGRAHRRSRFGYLVAGWSLQTAADHADRARLVLHPARRLPARAGALPAGAGRLRRPAWR